MVEVAREVTQQAPKVSGAGDMFQLLRDGRPRTRADLAAVTGQARSTVAARIDLLMEFDRGLKARAVNPGTSADLTVACLLVHILGVQLAQTEC